MTNIEEHAWRLSDTLAKTIDNLFKMDLKEVVRRKMIRDILKENLTNFYLFNSNTKEKEATR
jgi:hypothetical protein